MSAVAKPLASLSSGLLARPGQAKPAMRPQAFSYAPTEDLGWNDMGQQPTSIAIPAPVPVAIAAPAVAPVSAPVPPVVRQREELAAAIAPKPVTAAVTAAVPAAESAPVGRAAFTLRLDPARHLRLRLASAVSGRSSQQLVVAALDAFLDAQPEVAVSVRQVPAGTAKAVTGDKKC